MELAGSSGVQILVSEEAGAGVEVERLKGEYKLEEALASLLNDTGLTYEYASANVVLVQQEAQAEELQEVEAADDTAAPEEEQALELERQVVTGSRMIGGDPSARIYSFTAEDIARRGVSNLEEFFRKLPWSHASMTSQTSNAQVISTLDGTLGGYFDGNGLGISAVNLRGLGWENTLVLKDGRRVAGAGGVEDDFVNLLGVPLAAIERVDVQLDGASAVYGSDAIGGVVNFITKKDYRGLSATYRQEYSSTDADQTSANVTGGFAWSSGNVTAVLSRSTSEPITNAKTGWTTNDFRPLFGPEPGWDRRLYWSGQPGVACIAQRRQWSPRYPPSFSCAFGGTYYQLSPDHTGVGATVDDFATFLFNEPSAAPLDELPPQKGEDSERNGFNLALQQQLTENVRLFADLSRSDGESYQEYDRRIVNAFPVPASNAYNPFGVPVMVQYAAIYESENGLMPAQHDWSASETRTISAGIIWDISDNHQLQLDLNRSKSWRETRGFRARPTRGWGDPTAEAFYAALSSPDPAVALNVFGNGTVQGSFFEEFLTETESPFKGVTETREAVLSMRGQLFEIWGGPISYSLNARYNRNIIYSRGENTGAESTIVGVNEDVEWLLGSEWRVGVERPSRDTGSYSFELALPVVGPDNDVPGVHSLFVTLQGNWTTTESEGAGDGLDENWIPIRNWYWDPFAEDFAYVESTWPSRELNPSAIETAKVTDFVPRVGIQYRPTPVFTVKASWSRAYNAPNWSDQFSPRAPFPPSIFASSPWRQIIDPFDPDGPTEILREFGVTQQSVSFTPDLEPEYSDHWSASFEWAPGFAPGLRWHLGWSKTDYTNRIATSSRWAYDHPEFVFDNPKVAVRNERGDLVHVIHRDINLAGNYIEDVSTDLEYSFDTRWGFFRPRIGFVRYLDHYYQVTEDAARVDRFGVQSGVDKYKWNGSLSWERGGWTADVYLYYTPSYINDRALYCSSSNEVPGSRCTPENRGDYLQLPVSSLTTVDLTVTYRMDNGLRIRAGGQNVLDRGAPRTLSYSSSQSQPYDPARWDARGRVFFVELNWEMGADL